jgi:uncharacterized spore protein YtfJ
VDPSRLIDGVRDAMSVRRVFGEPVERDGVTVIPAATVIGGGGYGGGQGDSRPTDGKEADETGSQSGFGAGFGGVMWPAGAFEIADGRVTWRPAIDLTRVLMMALTLAIVLVRARSRR